MPPIESGRLSAFGLCPETKFRKVPVTAGQVGIAGTNPHRFFTIEADGGFGANPDIAVPYDEISGSPGLRRTILGAKDYAGGVTFKSDAENMLIPLYGVMGNDAITQLAGQTTTSITDVFQHVLTFGPNKPSFTAEEIFGRGHYGRLSSNSPPR